MLRSFRFASFLLVRHRLKMVQSWYMDTRAALDPRLPMHLFPPRMLQIDRLVQKTGIKYYKVNDVDDASSRRKIEVICKENGYTTNDSCTLSRKTLAPNEFNNKVKELYVETVSEWDTARLVLDGHCYYDIKDNRKKWVRVLLEKGDFIVIPKNTVYRFTTDTMNHVKMTRYYTQEHKDEIDYQHEVDLKLKLKNKLVVDKKKEDVKLEAVKESDAKVNDVKEKTDTREKDQIIVINEHGKEDVTNKIQKRSTTNNRAG